MSESYAVTGSWRRSGHSFSDFTQYDCLILKVNFLTHVVICEAHGHEVFGRTIIIHLVTSVNQ